MKKLKRILIFILAIAAIGVVLYKACEKKIAPQIDIGTFNLVEVEETSLNAYDTREDGDYYLLILGNDADSQYLLEHILVPLNDELKKHPFPSLEVVKLSDDDISLVELKKRWEINGFPSFVKITVLNQDAEITSKLEWTKETPFDVDDLKDWLDENGLWPEVVSYRN